MLSFYLVLSSLETVGHLLELKQFRSGFAPTIEEKFWKNNSRNNLYIITPGKNRCWWQIWSIFSDIASNRSLVSGKKKEENWKTISHFKMAKDAFLYLQTEWWLWTGIKKNTWQPSLCPVDIAGPNPCLVAKEPLSNLTLKVNKSLKQREMKGE